MDYTAIDPQDRITACRAEVEALVPSLNAQSPGGYRRDFFQVKIDTFTDKWMRWEEITDEYNALSGKIHHLHHSSNWESRTATRSARTAFRAAAWSGGGGVVAGLLWLTFLGVWWMAPVALAALVGAGFLARRGIITQRDADESARDDQHTLDKMRRQLKDLHDYAENVEAPSAPARSAV